MPKYTASDLRHTVEFLVKTRVPRPGGGVQEVYASLSPRWIEPAKVTPFTARERFFAGQTGSAGRATIVIRWRQGLDQGMRVRYGSRLFDVVGAIDVEERHEWIEIEAEEVFSAT